LHPFLHRDIRANILLSHNVVLSCCLKFHPRRVTESDLIKQREEERHAADPKPGHEAAHDRGAEGARSKKTLAAKQKYKS